MSEQRTTFDPDTKATGLARIAELRQVLDGAAPPAPDPEMQRAEREQAIEAIAASSAEWREEVAMPFIKDYLLIHPTLFVDDLWAAGLPEPHDRKALGPALREAHRRGWIVQTGDHRISASNSNPKPVWASRLYGADPEGDR